MKKLVIAALVVTVSPLILLVFLLFSESGLRLVVFSLEKLTGGQVKVEKAEGRLGGSFAAQGLSYTSATQSFDLRLIKVAWDPTKLIHGEAHLNSLFLDDLHFRGSAKEGEVEDDEERLSLPELEMPLSVEIDKLEATDILIESGQETAMAIDRIDLEVIAGKKSLQLNLLHLRNEFLDLHLSGTISPNGAWPVNLKGEYRYTIGDVPELHGKFAVTDTLENGNLQIILDAPFQADLVSRFSVKDGVEFHAELQAKDLDPAVMLPDLPGMLDGKVIADGAFSDGLFTADIDISTIEGRLKSYPLHISGNAHIDGSTLDISELAVVSGASRLEVAGLIDSEYQLAYNLTVPDMAAFFSEGAGAAQLKGEITGDLSRPRIAADLLGKNIAVDDFSVAALKADITADISAEAAGESMIDASAQLKGVGRQDQRLEEVSLDIAGNLDTHHIELHLLQDAISLSLAAEGSLQENIWEGVIRTFDVMHPQEGRIRLVDQAHLAMGPGKITLDGLCLSHDAALMCLQGGLLDNQWRAKAELRDIDPGYFLEQWTGKINAQIAGHGDLSQPSSHRFEIENLSGVLKGLPLNGTGSMEIQGESIVVRGLDLRYGDAFAVADGTISREGYDLHFSAEVPDFQTFMADLQGRLGFSGKLSGTREAPQLQFELTARDGQMDTFSFAALKSYVSVDLHENGEIEVDIQGDAIKNNELEISEASLQAAGTTADHTFEIRAMTGLGNGRLQGSGSYDSSWKGILESARFTMADYGDWSLDKNALVEIGKEKSGVEDFCLQADQAGFCLNGSVREEIWSVQAVTDGLPLALLNDFGITGFPVQGEMLADILAEGHGGRISRLEGTVSVPELLLAADGRDDGLTYIFSDNRIDAQMTEDSLSIALSSDFEESGILEGYLNIHGFDLAVLATTPLDGELEFHFADLSFITLLSNSRIIPTGSLQGKLDFNGTFEDPKVQGNIDLDQGVIQVADMGITLEEVSVEVSSAWGNAEFLLTAQSGPGVMQGEGRVSFAPEQGWKLTSHFSGTDFEVMATDEYVIRASPDIQLNLGEGGNTLSGDVNIPYGRITLEGSKGEVTPSEDVVIVDKTEEEQQIRSPFSTDLTISLGDDVRIDAYGLQSRLAGTIELVDVPGRILSAFGELEVEDGQFAFYSVELDITRGRLLFSGESVDNPGLDFRAHRKVEEMVVGVMVGGTANDPEFQLFSDPAMEESNILAYLLVGRAMYASTDNDQSLIGAAATALGIRGVNTITNTLGKYVPVDEVYLDGSTGSQDMSIVVGKNLTDDLFVGYDHNFFDSSGEFKVRYDLGKNFSIETRSSAESSSGDILYSIEK